MTRAPWRTRGSATAHVDVADDTRGLTHHFDALVVLQIERAVGDDSLARLQPFCECHGFGGDEGDAHRAALHFVPAHDENAGAVAIAFDDCGDRHIRKT